MSDKKHIDRIFQEKLKELDATPDKAVWDKIQKELNGEKKNRKVIPLWWKLAGVAAGLILLLTVGNLFLNNSDKTPVIVDRDEQIDTTDISTSNDTKIANSSNENDEKKLQEVNNETSIPKPKSSIQQENESIKNEMIANSGESNSPKNQSNSVVDNKPSIAQEDSNKNVLANNNKISEGINSTVNQPLHNIDNKAKEEYLNPNSKVLSENIGDSQKLTQEIESKDIINDKTNEQLVVEQEKEKIPLTEEVIVSNEDINEEEKETTNRWQIYPNVAPVYFNSLGKGSSLDEQFNDNPKTGELNTSYGVNVGYAINDKVTIKTGFNALALSYDTDNVIIYQNIGVSQSSIGVFSNIKIDNSELTMISASRVNSQQVNNVLGGNSNAAISQRLDYFEIPLEVDYKLINKKMGVNLTGGFSTFFLRNNEVVSELDSFNTYIGEATNINDVSYSLNIGFGFDFPLSKRMSFNIDPKFKYQINTFKNTSGNFRPYIIGLYTGLNYKF